MGLGLVICQRLKQSFAGETNFIEMSNTYDNIQFIRYTLKQKNLPLVPTFRDPLVLVVYLLCYTNNNDMQCINTT